MTENEQQSGFFRRHVLLISLLLGFVSLFGAEFALKYNLSSVMLSNSVLSLLGYVLIVWLIRKAILMADRRSLAFSLVMGALMAGALVIGTQIYRTDMSRLTEPVTWIKILFLLPLAAAVSIVLLRGLPTCRDWLARDPLNRFRTERLLTKRAFLLVWGGIFLCWIPVLLASWPGVYAYDAPYQMYQLLHDHQLMAHHPILHTLFLYGTLSFGERFLGSYEAGMAIYSVLQMLIMSAVFAYVWRCTARWRLSGSLQLLCILAFALLPTHSIFAVSATKDVLFTGAFTLCVAFGLDIVFDPARFFASWKLQLRFCLALFFMFALRNNGFYAFLLFVPFFLWTFRRYWKRALLLVLVCVCLQQLYFGPVHRLLNVADGNSREALCVPIQQLSRAMMQASDQLTAEEKAQIEALIPNWRKYSSRTADPAKNTFWTERFKENPGENLRLWATVGLKCPTVYVDAFLCNNFGYWYPDMIYPDPPAWHPYQEYRIASYEIAKRDDLLYLERQSKLPLLSWALEGFCYSVPHQWVPALSMLFSPGFMFWLLALYIAICWYQKRYIWITPAILLLALWATTLLGPVVLLRYVYPLFTCMPLLMAMLLGHRPEQETGLPE